METSGGISRDCGGWRHNYSLFAIPLRPNINPKRDFIIVSITDDVLGDLNQFLVIGFSTWRPQTGVDLSNVRHEFELSVDSKFGNRCIDHPRIPISHPHPKIAHLVKGSLGPCNFKRCSFKMANQ